MDEPLHVAVRMGDLEEVRSLLKKGVTDINGIGSLMWTPLHESVNNDDYDIVELLLRHGARTDIKDRLYGRIPVEIAREKCDEKLMKLLRNNSNNSTSSVNESEQNNQHHDKTDKVPSKVTSKYPKSMIVKSFKQNLANLDINFEYNSKKRILKIRIWKLYNILFPPTSISSIDTMYLRCYIRPDGDGSSKRKTAKIPIPRNIPINAIASSTKPTSLCFDDCIVYEDLKTDQSEGAIINFELCVKEIPTSLFANKKTFLLGDLKINLEDALSTTARETYSIAPCRQVLPPSIRCYYYDERNTDTQQIVGVVDASKPTPYKSRPKDENFGPITHHIVDLNTGRDDGASLKWDYEIMLPEAQDDDDADVVEDCIAGVHV